MENKETAAETTQHLTFSLAGEEYGLGVLRVREIIEYDTITRVPSTPAWVRGVINLRGGVVPIVDLGAKLGMPEGPVTKRTCIIIVEVTLDGEQALVGVIADAVNQVVDILPGDIEPPPAFGTAVRVDCLLGMARAGKKFVLLLDIDRVLSADALLAVAVAGEAEVQAGELRA